MSMKRIKLRLTLDVEYDAPAHVTEEELRNVLYKNASSSIQNGMLTGPLHDVEVDEHSMDVEIVKAAN